MRKNLVLITAAISCLLSACKTNEWTDLFDGKTLNGWQASENKSSWYVEDGMLVAKGSRSHLYYTGEMKDHHFRNFEFSADVMCTTGANSGIYFHTRYQEEGWPEKGYECQVFNGLQSEENTGYTLTGSLYAVRNISKSPVKDNEWFNYRIVVEGKNIKTYINNKLMVDYIEPDSVYRTEEHKNRVLNTGTFALQCHGSLGSVYFKNIRVKNLPENRVSPEKSKVNPELEAKIIRFSGRNFPLIDMHVHLKGGLTMDMAMEHARKYGFTYGMAVNCGLNMTYESEDSLKKFLAEYKKPANTFLAIQAEGREWMDIFSKETVSRFDYVFTDAMTWSDYKGKRMRLWIKEETEVGDPRQFMDTLVARIISIIQKEPIDIYVNATYIPDEIHERYEELWTDERMDRVIKALAEKRVALEINDRYRIPSSRFIRKAKEAGVKFTFGTNNAGAGDLGTLNYCLKIAEECGLTPEDMWYPDIN